MRISASPRLSLLTRRIAIITAQTIRTEPPKIPVAIGPIKLSPPVYEKSIPAETIALNPPCANAAEIQLPERNDADWLKTTLASYNANTNAPDLSYETVDISLIKPRKRDYIHAKKEA